MGVGVPSAVVPPRWLSDGDFAAFEALDGCPFKAVGCLVVVIVSTPSSS